MSDLLLGIIGICFGMTIAVGAAALASAIGVYPRLLAKVKGAKYILPAENCAMAGIVTGTILSVYPVRCSLFPEVLPFAGFFMGIYVGCLLMALAEVLQAFPIMFRRFHIKRGMSWLIFCVAFGKMLGSLAFFVLGW